MRRALLVAFAASALPALAKAQEPSQAPIVTTPLTPPSVQYRVPDGGQGQTGQGSYPVQQQSSPGYTGQQPYQGQPGYPAQQPYQGQVPYQSQPGYQNFPAYQPQPPYQGQQPYNGLPSNGLPSYQQQQPGPAQSPNSAQPSYQAQPTYQGQPAYPGQNGYQGQPAGQEPQAQPSAIPGQAVPARQLPPGQAQQAPGGQPAPAAPGTGRPGGQSPSAAVTAPGQPGQLPGQPGQPGQPPTEGQPPEAIAPAPANVWVPQGGAILQALDKVNAVAQTLTVKNGQTVTFGSLRITVQSCEIRPPDVPPDAAAFLVITDSHADQPGFTGWMIKSDPSLSLLEHPLYDVRVEGCTP